MAYYYGSEKGNVFFKKGRDPPEQEPRQNADLAQRRLHLTHVCFICDDPSVQPLLPQIIIGNFNTFLVRDMLELLDDTPKNVYLVRQKSAWNNIKLMVKIVNLLVQCLGNVLDRFHVIFSLDACGLHCAPEVIDAIVRGGLHYLLVPASLTWLLQPCDTHLFVIFKRFLKNAYVRLRVELSDGTFNIKRFLEVVYDALRVVVQGRRWKPAFLADGYGNTQKDISEFIRRHIGFAGQDLCIADTMPTEESIQILFPINKQCYYGKLFRMFLPATLALPAPPPRYNLSFAIVSARVRQMIPRRQPSAAVSVLQSGAPASSSPTPLLALPAPPAEWQETQTAPLTRLQRRLRLEGREQTASLQQQRVPTSAAQPSAGASSPTSTAVPSSPIRMSASASASLPPRGKPLHPRRRPSPESSGPPKRHRAGSRSEP